MIYHPCTLLLQTCKQNHTTNLDIALIFIRFTTNSKHEDVEMVLTNDNFSNIRDRFQQICKYLQASRVFEW